MYVHISAKLSESLTNFNWSYADASDKIGEDIKNAMRRLKQFNLILFTGAGIAPSTIGNFQNVIFNRL